MTALEAYALAKKIAISAVSGIASYSIDGTTLVMTTNDGQVLRMTFPTPKDGVGIQSTKINANKHLIITYDDGTTEDAGLLPGTDVDVTQILETGIKIAEISVDGRKTNIFAPKGGGSAELQTNLLVTKTVGGVNAGASYAQGTSLEQIIRDILAPTLYPTLTNPSATISASGAKLIETGGSLSTTMTVSFNRGSINPAYGTSGHRSGAATGYSLNGGASQSGNTFSVTVTSAQTTYQASVAYGAGEQPKDSSGADYNSPLPAGSVNTNTISYEFVDALWANTTNIASVAKLALVSKTAKQKDFVFPAQTVANPEVFDVPASWTVTAIQVKNDLSGAYEDAADQFTITNVTHNDAAGNSVNYKRYTFNLGYDTGARTVRLKWS